MKKTISLIMILFVLLSLLACFGNNTNNSNEDIIPDNNLSDNGDKTSDEKPEEIDFTKMTVNCLGDSLTYGANPDGSQMSKPYPTLLKEELGFSIVNNFGIGGTKIANEGAGSFTVRYAEMPDADIVLVMGGTNDSLSFSLDMVYRTPLGTPNDLSEETFYGALNSLCYKLQNKYKDSFIAFITPLPIATATTEWVYATGSFTIEEACTAIKTVCSRYNIPVFDAYNLTGYGDICNSEKSNGTGDGIHPSQEFWATDFTPKLAQFIKDNYE